MNDPVGGTVDDLVQLQDLTPGSHTTSWSIPNGNPSTSTATALQVRFPQPGEYAISLVVTAGGRTSEPTVKRVTIRPRNSSSVDRMSPVPVGSTFAMGQLVHVSFDVTIGAAAGGKVEVQPLSGGQPTPGVGPFTSPEYDTGVRNHVMDFTVGPGPNPVRIDELRVRILMNGTAEELAVRRFPVSLTFVGPVVGPESCLPYRSVELLAWDGGPTPNDGVAQIVLDGQALGPMFNGRAAQTLALRLFQANDQYCIVGMTWESMQGSGVWDLSYFDGPRPMPSFPGESCQPYDALALQPRDRGAGVGWELTGGGVTMPAGRTAQQAQTALSVARRATRYCTIWGEPGNPTSRLEYFR